jgi:hypothetical protein
MQEEKGGGFTTYRRSSFSSGSIVGSHSSAAWMTIPNFEIAGARYRSDTFPSLMSLEHMTEEGSLQGRLESEPVSSTDRDRGTRVRG